VVWDTARSREVRGQAVTGRGTINRGHDSVSRKVIVCLNLLPSSLTINPWYTDEGRQEKTHWASESTNYGPRDTYLLNKLTKLCH